MSGSSFAVAAQSKILVIGATGTVGRQVVSQLLDTGTGVRALVRDPDSAALPANVELVRGDLSDPADLTAASDGAAEQIRTDGVVRWPYAAAARSLIHEADIAAVAVRALTGDGHAGNTYVLTGPQRLTQAEQVHTIGEAIGRRLRFEEISQAQARPGLVAVFGDEAFADSALDTWATFVAKPERVTSTVQAITGSPARSLRDWASDHADDFR